MDEQNSNLQENLTSDRERINQVDDAQLLLDIEQLINESIGRVESLNQELSKQNEMLNSVLENDSVYVNHLEASKEANRVKNNTKREILKRSDVSQTAQRVSDIRAEVKDTKEKLSGYLYEYAKVSGSNEFEARDGTVRKIVYTAKLVKQ